MYPEQTLTIVADDVKNKLTHLYFVHKNEKYTFETIKKIVKDSIFYKVEACDVR
jgi:hypothetical protein